MAGSLARLVLWFLAVLMLLQLAYGGTPRLKQWLSVKFVGAR